MPTNKFIEINERNDISALFKEVCALLGITELDAKRIHLGVKGPDNLIRAKEPTLNDIASLCEKNRFKFTFRVHYTTSEIPMNKVEEKLPDPHAGMKVSDVHTKMEEQRKEITNPELLAEHVTQILPPAGEIKKEPIDVSKIPDFM